VGSVKRAELLDDIVAARPEAGELIYIERRGEDYRWTRTNPGDTVDMPETGGFPDAWMYYSGRWPIDEPEKLPAFTAPPHTGVRVEACQSCKTYVKSVDLTVDARRVPEIDELVALSLDLWAVEQGYERLEPGLAGL